MGERKCGRQGGILAIQRGFYSPPQSRNPSLLSLVFLFKMTGVRSQLSPPFQRSLHMAGAIEPPPTSQLSILLSLSLRQFVPNPGLCSLHALEVPFLLCHMGSYEPCQDFRGQTVILKNFKPGNRQLS